MYIHVRTCVIVFPTAAATDRQSGDIPDRARTFSVLYRPDGSSSAATSNSSNSSSSAHTVNAHAIAALALANDPLCSLDIECDDDKVIMQSHSLPLHVAISFSFFVTSTHPIWRRLCLGMTEFMISNL